MGLNSSSSPLHLYFYLRSLLSYRKSTQEVLKTNPYQKFTEALHSSYWVDCHDEQSAPGCECDIYYFDCHESGFVLNLQNCHCSAWLAFQYCQLLECYTQMIELVSKLSKPSNSSGHATEVYGYQICINLRIQSWYCCFVSSCYHSFNFFCQFKKAFNSR